MHSKFSRLSQFVTKLNIQQSLSVSSQPVDRSRKHKNRAVKQKLAVDIIYVGTRRGQGQLETDQASDETSIISIPQNQSSSQGNTKIALRRRNWLYIVREYNSNA